MTIERWLRRLAMMTVLCALGLAPRAHGQAWMETRKLVPNNAETNDVFGNSVAVKGGIVAIGSNSGDGAAGDSGAVYIYERDVGGTNNFGFVKKLNAFDGVFGDEFSFVAISGETVIIGAPSQSEAGTRSGAAYIFEKNQGGQGFWGQVKKILPSDADAFSHFGLGTGLDGDTAVVGRYLDSQGGDRAGAAYLFERDLGGTDNWGQRKKLLPSDVGPDLEFGSAVAISGDTVVVGAWMAAGATASSGAAYVFQRNQGGANNWGQVKKLIAFDGANDELFGASVAIDGDTVAVGASQGSGSGAVGFPGSVYLFERNQGGANNWGQVRKIHAADEFLNDYFGFSVSLDGDRLLVGAYRNDDLGSGSGSAYIFGRNTGGANQWGQVHKFLPSDGALSDEFGVSVALDGDSAVIGSWRDSVPFSEQGSAYVFLDTALFADGFETGNTSRWTSTVP